MNRNRLIPLVGVAIAVAVLMFLFFASAPDPQDEQDGVVGAEVVDDDEQGGATAPADVVVDE
jgi:hypothetical protein